MFGKVNQWYTYYLEGDPERGSLVWKRGGVSRAERTLPPGVNFVLTDPYWAVVFARWRPEHADITDLWVPDATNSSAIAMPRLASGRPRAVYNEYDGSNVSLAVQVARITTPPTADVKLIAGHLACAWRGRLMSRGVEDDTNVRRESVRRAFERVLEPASRCDEFFFRVEAVPRFGSALSGSYQLVFDGKEWVVAGDDLWVPRAGTNGAVDAASLAVYAEERKGRRSKPRAVVCMRGGRVYLAAEVFGADSRGFASFHLAKYNSRYCDHFLRRYDDLPHEAWLWGLSTSDRRKIARTAVRKWLEGLIPERQLLWGGGTVLELAETIWKCGTWADLKILADALEDAGNDNAKLLAACRSEDIEGAQAALLAAEAYRRWR